MEFEDIKSEKFSQFENHTISNLRLVVGGDWTNTEDITPTDIDRFNTGTAEHPDGWEQSHYVDDHIPWGIG